MTDWNLAIQKMNEENEALERANQETSTVRESQEWCRYLREKKGLVSTMPSEARNFAAIADHIATLTARIEALHLMQELGEDLAWRSYLGIQVLQTVLKKSKLEAGADVSAKLLTDIAIQYPHFPAKSALRPAAAVQMVITPAP